MLLTVLGSVAIGVGVGGGVGGGAQRIGVAQIGSAAISLTLAASLYGA